MSAAGSSTASRQLPVDSGPAIRAVSVTKRYGSTLAVDGVSLEVATGEFFGILGPNGAGKTTFLEIVEGLRRPDGGSVELLGADPAARRSEQARRVGVQFQAAAFFDRLTAREQLRTFAALYAVPASAADAWLERVGLTDKAATRTEALSGGQRQRLAIACALVHEPDVVFLDEPTAALDPQSRRNLWDLLGSLSQEGRTVVLTTHHMDEAETLCDRVAIMDHGQVLVEDRPSELIRSLHAPMRILVGPGRLAPDEVEALTRLPGVTREPADGEGAGQDGPVQLTAANPAALIGELGRLDALEGLQVQGATLEDVFLELTGRAYRA